MSSSKPSLLANDILLIFAAEPPHPDWIAKTEAQYPGFKVRWEINHTPDGELRKAADLPPGIWDGVTILCCYAPPPAELIPKVRFVQLSSAGSDKWSGHQTYLDKNIIFSTSSGAQPPQIAEWVIGTWLAHQHQYVRYLDNMRNGYWDMRLEHQVEDSAGLRIGILGYGAIGRQVARLTTALGMEVYAFTHKPRTTPESRVDRTWCVPGMGDPEGKIPAKWFHGSSTEDVNEFLAQDLDILVISLPLTASTHHLISSPQFNILSKKKTFVSNVARGPIVDTDALRTALETEQIRGAALDVTDPEPLPADHPLWKARNIYISPHVSWLSTRLWDRIETILTKNLEKLALGEPLLNVLDRH